MNGAGIAVQGARSRAGWRIHARRLSRGQGSRVRRGRQRGSGAAVPTGRGPPLPELGWSRDIAGLDRAAEPREDVAPRAGLARRGVNRILIFQVCECLIFKAELTVIQGVLAGPSTGDTPEATGLPVRPLPRPRPRGGVRRFRVPERGAWKSAGRVIFRRGMDRPAAPPGVPARALGRAVVRGTCRLASEMARVGRP